MKISIKKSLAVSLLILLSFPTAKPISEGTADLTAALGGVVAGGIGGAAAYAALASNLPNSDLNTPLAVVAALGSGALTWWCLSKILFQYTPRGKYQQAAKNVRTAELDTFIQNNFSCAQDVIGHVNIKFGTNWPLVLARRHLNNMVSDLSNASELLDEAMETLRGDNNKKSDALFNKCNDLYNRIPAIIITIEELMKPIINHNDFQHQTKIYENHVEAERQRQFEREKQQREYEQKRREKEKEREFKQNVLQNTNHQVVVKI
jgi:hypothetical protein